MPATFLPHRKRSRTPLGAMLPIGLVSAIVAQTAQAQTGTETPLSTLPLLVDLGMMQEGAAAPRIDPHSSEHHHHGLEFTDVPPPLGSNLLEGWLDEWSHTHFSRRGTPYVHAFGFEPAFLGRELFLDFSLTDGDEGQEYELEAELEYAFTRRLGIVIEAGYAWLDPDGASDEDGFGDIAVAPRFLLLDYDQFLLSANLEFEFPTGDEDRDLGAGETIFAPSLSAWLDLGNSFTLQGNIGLEHGLSSDSDVFTWGGSLAYTIYTKGQPELVTADGAVRSHFPEGQLSLIAELLGEHPLDGDEDGQGTGAWLFAASYSLTPNIDLRAGVTLPAWRPREFDNGAVFGVIVHF
ncbi:MAG: transporter [Planctomycetota bacterium]